MGELQIFENSEFDKIRVIMKDNNSWFVAKDVTSCLGHTNSRKAFIDYCKKTVSIGGVTFRYLPQNIASLDPQTKIIPESEYVVYLDTGQKYSDGTPIRQLKWSTSIVNIIIDHLGLGN